MLIYDKPTFKYRRRKMISLLGLSDHSRGASHDYLTERLLDLADLKKLVRSTENEIDSQTYQVKDVQIKISKQRKAYLKLKEELEYSENFLIGKDRLKESDKTVFEEHTPELPPRDSCDLLSSAETLVIEDVSQEEALRLELKRLQSDLGDLERKKASLENDLRKLCEQVEEVRKTIIERIDLYF